MLVSFKKEQCESSKSVRDIHELTPEAELENGTANSPFRR